GRSENPDSDTEQEFKFKALSSPDITINWQPPILLSQADTLEKGKAGIYILEKQTRKGHWTPYYGGRASVTKRGKRENSLRTRLIKHRRNMKRVPGNSARSHRVRIGIVERASDKKLELAERFLIRTLAYRSRKYKYDPSELLKANPRHYITNKPRHITNDQSFKPFEFGGQVSITLKGSVPGYLTKTLNSIIRANRSRHRAKFSDQISRRPKNIYSFKKGTQYEAEDNSATEASSSRKSWLANKARQAILIAALSARLLGHDPHHPGSGRSARQPSIEYRLEERKERRKKGRQHELEWEAEPEPTTHQKHDFDSQLEDLGYAAAAAQTEAEAEALVGAMVPLAAQLIPRVKPLMMASSPAILAGLGAATKLLHRNPKTRPLLRTMPTVLHHTAAVLNRDRINGRRPTPKRVVKVLADQAAKVIASPDETRRALQHAQEMSHHH
ncbi:MAG: hypothetical protein AAFQ89_07380, partial [Cyanobacteria bacterium J06626_18]